MKALLPHSEQIVAAYTNGRTVLELAAQWSANRKIILKLLKSAGVKSRGLSNVTDAVVDEMIRLHESGIDVQGVASQLNVTYQMVLRKLRSREVAIRLKKSAHPNEVRQQIVDAYQMGKSTTDIEKEFGIASCVSYNILLSEGVALRKQRQVKDEETQRIVSLYSTGKSLESIGTELGFSWSTVRNVLIKAGIERRNQKETSARNWLNPDYAHAVNSKRIILVGEKHPSWQGGKTSLSKIIRSSKEYENWRLAVFVRDKGTCQHCGTRGNKRLNPLEADHIFPFSALLHRHKITDRQQAIDCPELWDINNGRTLCKSCHRQTDTYTNGAKKYIMKQ